MPTKSSPTELTVTWQCSPFDELTAGELYAVMEARQRVFVVEQQCAYLDADGSDHLALHLLGWRNTQDGLLLAAYARLFPPGAKYREASIGRVLTHPAARGCGLGKALMLEAIQRIADAGWGTAIRVAAQMYLEAFYEEFDFHRVSDPYIEDEIWHVDMLRSMSEANVASLQ
jgi:ElaA protein